MPINVNRLLGLPDTAAYATQLAPSDITTMALLKGEERYIFLFDDEHKAEALRTFGRFATNPELSFSWYDAAVLSQKVRTAAPGSGQ
jgi:hypothetical protein